jgi:hypothetical protein
LHSSKFHHCGAGGDEVIVRRTTRNTHRKT